jgi:uncharacterized UBP type Zn finger protein
MSRIDEQLCVHFTPSAVQPRSAECQECGSGDNLRMCTECGHVGCCESQLAHNTQHYRESGHPVIKSIPIDHRSFTWCYECERYL